MARRQFSAMNFVLFLVTAVHLPLTGALGQAPAPGGLICGTQERWESKGLQRPGPGCELGQCDFAPLRDSWIPDASTPMRALRMHVIVFANTDGSNPTSTQEQVDLQINQLNSDLAPARIFFCHTTEFVNDSTHRSVTFQTEQAMKELYARGPESQLNVYVVDLLPNGLLGVGTFPWDPNALGFMGGILIDEVAFGAFHEVLTHEVGHCLGLWHTFHGVDEVQEPCDDCYERADGLNGDSTGDFASDTAPTPLINWCGDPFGSDSCSGIPWGSTDPQNYMSYGQEGCWTEFSTQQFGRMHCWTNEVLTGWSCGPPFGACCEGHACRLDTPEECSATGGTYNGDWTRCQGFSPNLYCGDCNDNGLDDACDVSCGAAGEECDLPGCGLGPDCNNNGVLDSCDFLSTESDDCNGNQVPDECDTASAASEDCNLNSVPDECETLDDDCNNNGIRDDCDTLTGPSEDCNLNLIPDECETLDVDCNNNGIRDDCDIATGPSEDCNLNGVPDECETLNVDCNNNGIRDDCDIITGPSNDCNENLIPDECDFGPLPTKIYWGDSTGRIMRSDVNGGAGEEVLATATIPQAMTIDPLRRKIYWSDANDASVHRANLDGTEAEIVLAGIDSNHERAGLAIDPFDFILYYTQTYDGEFGTNGGLQFVFLPGTNPQFISGSSSTPTRDVALHLPSKSLYWLRELNSPPLCTLQRADIVPYPYDNVIDQIPVSNSRTMTIDATRDEIITGTSTAIRRYAHLGGAVLGTIVPGNTPTSMTNDPFDGNGFIYWTSSTTGEIKRASRSGAIVETIHSGLPQPGPIAVIRAVDCNANGVEDICEISCGTPCGPCDVPGCGTAIDCDRDGLLDVCEPFQDCNGNSVDDRCDIASQVAGDCNLNGIPDVCEGPDCNGNTFADQCDIDDGTSEDCNANAIPDECDIDSGLDTDCNESGVPDLCEPGTYFDCNGNARRDDCDIDLGFSTDLDSDSIPDECGAVVPPLVPDAFEKPRFISFTAAPIVGATQQSALRVKLVNLQPYPGDTVDFYGVQYMWVGPPALFPDSSGTPSSFFAADLQCVPHYRDWSTVGLVHVTGNAVVPNSLYEVHNVAATCAGNLGGCASVSPPLEVRTTRWGDVRSPFNPPDPSVQPDISDVSSLVDKFRSAPGAPIKARGLLAGAAGNPWGIITPEVLNVDFGFSHISACVDAFRGLPYPYEPGYCRHNSVGAPCHNYAQCPGDGYCHPCPGP